MVAAKPSHENSVYSLRGRRCDSAVLMFLRDIDGPFSEAGELHHFYSAAVAERDSSVVMATAGWLGWVAPSWMGVMLRGVEEEQLVLFPAIDETRCWKSIPLQEGGV
jgi:hypothetical protein